MIYFQILYLLYLCREDSDDGEENECPDLDRDFEHLGLNDETDESDEDSDRESEAGEEDHDGDGDGENEEFYENFGYCCIEEEDNIEACQEDEGEDNNDEVVDEDEVEDAGDDEQEYNDEVGGDCDDGAVESGAEGCAEDYDAGEGDGGDGYEEGGGYEDDGDCYGYDDNDDYDGYDDDDCGYDDYYQMHKYIFFSFVLPCSGSSALPWLSEWDARSVCRKIQVKA